MKHCYLVGVGLGNPQTLTIQAKEAIERSAQLIGAQRLLDAFCAHGGKKLALISAQKIADAVRAFDGDTAVLLSGDPGFYSGAAALYARLDFAEVETIPGISSVNYFCARLHTAWQDVKLVSVHGRSANAVGEMQSHKKTFFLTGSNCTVSDLCKQMTGAGFGGVTVHVGERLSYPDERILTATAAEFSGRTFDTLAVMLVENPTPTHPHCGAPRLLDEEMQRGKTPMTKEAVRMLCVARLGVQPDSTVWDIGAGTGSVSCACAMAAYKGQVYAVERDEEALLLIRANRENLGVWNLHVVEGNAPEALSDLPAPDCVFIGGSGGKMAECVKIALEKNPAARVCITAVSLESFTDALACVKQFALQNLDVTQLSVAQAKTLGAYHMMLGQNPVWIVSAEAKA